MSKRKIEGWDELVRTMKKLEKLPKKHVTRSAKKGARIALSDAKANAPEEDGNLKKGIILKGERNKPKGKKVFQVTFDPAMNDVFVKTTKNGKRYYYPASQEYGYMTRDGGYVPGFHFLRNSIEDNSSRMERVMVDTMGKEIDKLR